MRIGIFIDDYLPSVHGVATSTTSLKKALEDLGHEVYIIAPKCKGYDDDDDHVIRVPQTPTLMWPLLTVVPLQIFAAALAEAKGLDVDQPRNLAKSVTVE